MISDSKIAEWQRLAEVATPGGWKWWETPGVKWDDPKSCGYDSRTNDRTAPYFATGPHADTPEQASLDAAFIAAARECVPALLAERRELIEALEGKRAVAVVNYDKDQLQELVNSELKGVVAQWEETILREREELLSTIEDLRCSLREYELALAPK